MKAALPLGVTGGVALLLLALLLFAFTMRFGLRGAWSSKTVQRLTVLLFGSVLASLVFWGVAARTASYQWSHRAGVVSSVLLVVMAFVVGSIPFAALVWNIAKPRKTNKASANTVARLGPLLDKANTVALLDPLRDKANTVPREGYVSRRVVAKALAASVPVIATGAAISGFREGQRAPLVRMLPLAFPNLHADLEGLRILQLSDLHLGYTRSARDLEQFMASLETRPDLVVFTGDVADDLRELDRALRVVRDFAPKHGVFSCLGNHEYHHDVAFVRRAHQKAKVELLVNEGGIVRVGGARIYLGGVNDPIRLDDAAKPVLARSAALAMRSAPSDVFRLLLSHRPEGFESAEAQDVDLTLSGHTHGGHIGFLGRSAFQPIWPERYLWGLLQREHRSLYTTSGFGHWFPFRLGCPTEAPFITLQRA